MGRSRKGRPIHGWIVLDKPKGMSSAHAVARVRRIAGAAKAGHGGTLDPLATGVLPVALGEATKTTSWAMAGDKTYRFTLRWGESRDTDDSEGAVTATSEARPAEAEVLAALDRFTGDILQRPPRYSALKLDGRRSYDLARAAVDFDLPERAVTIEALVLLDMPDADRAVFEMRCGKGTYVRSLARDLALALGTVGHAEEIRRLAVGPFAEPDSIPLDRLERLVHSAPAQDYLLPIEAALDDIPAVPVSESQASLLRHGQPVRISARERCVIAAERVAEGDTVVAVGEDGAVALARVDNGTIRPTRVINP